MHFLKTFRVKPALPPRLKPLLNIAHNLWWTWNSQASDLFRNIDLDLWYRVKQNPVALLGQLSQEQFQELESLESFLSHMDTIEGELKAYLTRNPWFTKRYPDQKDFGVAYFSAEYGMHESLALYSGGLGILSGDHLKASADLEIPLVGLGLAYSNGYFHQFLNADGWQQEKYLEQDFMNMPMSLECDEKDNLVLIEIDLPGRKVYAQIWRIEIGNTRLYLMDTNIKQNQVEDREITAKLYGGDNDMRIKQEILLGIGGIRTMQALGLSATVYHMNEGHSAFMALERVRDLIVNQSLDFDQAREVVSASNVFTTHTPVPAGLDRFPNGLIDQYFRTYHSSLGLDNKRFLDLGKSKNPDNEGLFGMANLAISLSHRVNGVSVLHAEVSRGMWHQTWENIPLDEVPILSVTNGVHLKTWLSEEIIRLFDRYLGPSWGKELFNQEIWDQVDRIPNTELWRSQERLKERLIVFARNQFREELQRVGAPLFEIQRVDEVLDPEALTICFARRFATYKRSTLIFRDLERLARILSNKEKPVQILFAGKAHPKDNEGKELIKRIYHIMREEPFRTKVLFLEDYDIRTARYMVQGTDLWLNTPRKPMEASGTSGMKASLNGGLNVSILDGWWCEGYQSDNGWAIGSGEIYEDAEYQDEIESNAIYDLLENEIVPLYYNRGSGESMPRVWVNKMKRSIQTLSPLFNANRMLRDYTEKLYFPAHKSFQRLTQNHFQKAKDLAKSNKKLNDHWHEISIQSIHYGENQDKENQVFRVGERVKIHSKILLGAFTPEEIEVELYYGTLDSLGQISQPRSIPMEQQNKQQKHSSNKIYEYSGEILCEQGGQYAFAVRSFPKSDELFPKFHDGFIHWNS